VTILDELPEETGDPLEMLFLPLDKSALGGAVAVTAALLMFLATAIPLVRGLGDPVGLWLLGNYFNGYSVTWPGAFIGAAWAAFTGFIAGWFIAFSRNTLLAIRLVVLRARAEYAQTRDFLDHI
jgi:hypothetical protein